MRLPTVQKTSELRSTCTIVYASTNKMSWIVHNLTGNPCVIFSKQEVTVAKIRLGASYLALSLCVIAGLVILCSKLYQTLTHRLYGYLTVANIFYSMVFTIQYFAEDFEQNLVFHVPCVIAGFLMQYTGWVVLLLTSIITVHLFIIIVYNRKYTGVKIEVFYVAFSVVFPLLFCWIPFINDTYGLSGDWCWIRWADFDKPNITECPLHLQGLIEKLALWSGPMIILVFVSSAAAVYMIVVLIKRARRRNTYDHLEKKYRALLKEALPFLTFPVAFYIICIFEISNHIYYALHFFEPNFGLWVVNAIGAPFRAVPIILALLCPGVIIKCKRRREVLKVLRASRNSQPGDEQIEPKLLTSLNRTEAGYPDTDSDD